MGAALVGAVGAYVAQRMQRDTAQEARKTDLEKNLLTRVQQLEKLDMEKISQLRDIRKQLSECEEGHIHTKEELAMLRVQLLRLQVIEEAPDATD